MRDWPRARLLTERMWVRVPPGELAWPLSQARTRAAAAVRLLWGALASEDRVGWRFVHSGADPSSGFGGDRRAFVAVCSRLGLVKWCTGNSVMSGGTGTSATGSVSPTRRERGLMNERSASVEAVGWSSIRPRGRRQARTGPSPTTSCAAPADRLDQA